MNRQALNMQMVFFSRGGSAACSKSDADLQTCDILLKTGPNGRIQASRSQKEKERNPDRICLDRYIVMWTICNMHAVYR
jgi:hypothetical protein